MRRRQVSEASGNAWRRGLCYKCMLRGSEEHWALAQYGLAQTRAEHSPLISQIESRAHRPARAARHVRSEVSCDSERTGSKSLYSADAKRAHDTRQDFFRFHEVLIATVFCDFSARGAPVPKDQEPTARSRVRLDTCRCQVVCILYSRLQSHHASAQTRIEPVLTSSPRLTRQLAQCPGMPRRP
jgi:hypothetical protein